MRRITLVSLALWVAPLAVGCDDRKAEDLPPATQQQPQQPTTPPSGPAKNKFDGMKVMKPIPGIVLASPDGGPQPMPTGSAVPAASASGSASAATSASAVPSGKASASSAPKPK